MNLFSNQKKQLSVGTGAFAEVNQVLKDGVLTAKKTVILNNPKWGTQDQTYFTREFEICQKLQQLQSQLQNNLPKWPGIRNIIQYYDCQQDSEKMVYYMEWCDKNMKQHLEKNYGDITEKDVKKWAKQLLEALIFLKTVLNTTHRDLKLDNLMLDSNEDIKLIDFTLAKSKIIDEKLENDQVEVTKVLDGFRTYKSPERLQRQKVYDNFKSDVWSIGVIIYFLTFNEYPFDGREIQLNKAQQAYFKFEESYQENQRKAVEDLNMDGNPQAKKLYETLYQPSNVNSPELQDLLKKIFLLEEKRLNFEQIINHPWFALDGEKLTQQISQIRFSKIQEQPEQKFKNSLYYIHCLRNLRNALRFFQFIRQKDEKLIYQIVKDEQQMIKLVQTWVKLYKKYLDYVQKAQQELNSAEIQGVLKSKFNKEFSIYSQLLPQVSRYFNEQQDKEFVNLLKHMSTKFIGLQQNLPDSIQDLYKIQNEIFVQSTQQTNFQGIQQLNEQVNFYGYWKIVNKYSAQEFQAEKALDEIQKVQELLNNDKQNTFKKMTSDLMFPLF